MDIVFRLALAAGLMVLLLTGCTGKPAPAEQVTDAAGARDAALEYLREHDPDNAPGTGLKWQSEDATPEGLVGQATKVFTSDGLTVKVNSPVVAPEYINHNLTITSVQGGWHWQVNIKRDGTVTETSALTLMSEEWSRDIAEDYVMSSPTFRYDGMEDTLELANTLTARCPYCWVFNYEFTSRAAGYGDREGMMLAQVLTGHIAVISIEQGEVKSAVMDETWDMMRQEEIE